MAYMNQERKAKISAAVTPILRKYGVKGTLKVDHYSSITLTLSEGAVDFVEGLKPHRYEFGSMVKLNKDALRESALDVNQYWYHEHYMEASKAFAFLQEIIPAMKAADWYDRSDARIDYFDTAYYFNIKIGRWNKPYKVTR